MTAAFHSRLSKWYVFFFLLFLRVDDASLGMQTLSCVFCFFYDDMNFPSCCPIDYDDKVCVLGAGSSCESHVSQLCSRPKDLLASIFLPDLRNKKRSFVC